MPKKPLAWGYTTGTCAQAATKAAMQMLLAGRQAEKIEVELPGGKCLLLSVEDLKVEYEGGQTEKAEGKLPVWVSCAVRKDSGDDPDITNGILVYSRVWRSTAGQFRIDGGEGIGRVTKPGLEQPVGAAAINRVPRQMIRKEVEAVCEETGYEGGIVVEISIPGGKVLAAKTFNPRLGIEGGLSVIGTSGLVQPMSEQALIDTIRLEIQMKMAQGCSYLVVTPGNYGLEFLDQEYGIAETQAVKCSNFIGEMLDAAVEKDCKGILLAGHIGKLVKTAGGIMNTHSRCADCRMELLASAALRIGMDAEKARGFLDCTTTDDALSGCSGEEQRKLTEQLIRQAQRHISWRTEGQLQVEMVLFSKVYGILGKSGGADGLVRSWKREQERIEKDRKR